MVPKFRVEEGTIECRAETFGVNPSRDSSECTCGPQASCSCDVFMRRAAKMPGLLHVNASLELLLARVISISTCVCDVD